MYLIWRPSEIQFHVGFSDGLWIYKKRESFILPLNHDSHPVPSLVRQGKLKMGAVFGCTGKGRKTILSTLIYDKMCEKT